MRAGRVYTMTGGVSPSGLAVPVEYSVDLLAMQQTATGAVTLWRRLATAPDPAVETETVKADAGGTWWSLVADPAIAAEEDRATAAEGLIDGHAVDVALLHQTATKGLIRDHGGLIDGHAADVALLYQTAMKGLVRDYGGLVDGHAADVALLRQTAARTDVITADLELEDLQWSVSGQVISIYWGRSAFRSAGRALYFGGDVEIPSISREVVTDEARTISWTSGNTAFVFSGDGRLDHARVASVVVTDAVTSDILIAGVDYLLNAEQGAIVLAASGSDRPVTVTYSWSAIRYDLIEVDGDGALHVVTGTYRDRDVQEFVPSATAGRRAILTVRVTADGLTVWPWNDRERALISAPALRQRARARNLGNFRRALSAGAVSIAGYGTSRTNLGAAAASPYLPNGAERDTLASSGFLLTQAADVISAIPLYDHGDGAGAVHTHIGWMWELERAIRRLHTDNVTYLNLGIGGSTSASTISTGGTYPDRLAGLTGSGAHLAVVEFGTNELGVTSVDTTANLVTIGEACSDADMDVIFMAPGRVNAQYASDALDRWIAELRQVQSAADYLQVPFVDTTSIYGVDRPGLLDPRDCAGSNLYNHDSIAELTALGRALTAISLDI